MLKISNHQAQVKKECHNFFKGLKSLELLLIIK